MKYTGIIRRIDSLGRIVLPKEIRDMLEFNDAPIEILVENGNVILRRYRANCVFCGSFDGVSEFKGKTVCEKCRNEISTQTDK